MDRNVHRNRSLRRNAIRRAWDARREYRAIPATDTARRTVAFDRYAYVRACLRAMRAKVHATSVPVGRNGRPLTGAARKATVRKATSVYDAARKAERSRYYHGADGSRPLGW